MVLWEAICTTLARFSYFRDDPTLNDVVILKPNWVARAISLVLENKGIRDRSGILVETDLPRIWDVDEYGQKYDLALYPLFLRLMERFDLCYQITSQLETYYFIPQLVAFKPPSFLPSWTIQDMKAGKVHVEVIYRLDFVPTGIMNWFIVRTHQYTCSMHWHDGVVLSHQGYLARVELFSKRKELHMEVWGPEPYTFFMLLKETMDLILARFKGLNVRQEVPCSCHRQMGEVQPCSEVYRYEQDLVRRLNQSVEIVQCRESFCNIAVRELLYGHNIVIDPKEYNSISNETDNIMQRLDAIAEQQDKLRSEVIAEQKNIVEQLNSIAERQRWKESTSQRRPDSRQYNVPQYKGESSEPPSPLKQAWDWYSRQQPRKKKKPLSKFKIGCIAIIVGFFLCAVLSRMLSGSNVPSPNGSPSRPALSQHVTSPHV